MNVGVTIRQRVSGLARAQFRLVIPLLLLLNLLGLFGFFVRDRTVFLALLLYLPLLPLGLCAIILGLVRRRLISRGVLSLLIGIGSISTAVNSFWMLGRGSAAADVPEDRRLSILQWNVMWGGLAIQSKTPWAAIAGEVIEQSPDLVVLSEAPFVLPLYQRLERLPGRRFGLSLPHFAKGTHPFHLFVSARWPVHLERWLSIADGGAAVVLVDHPDGAIRLILVDGVSSFTRLRTRMLHDIALACTEASDAGDPVDFILGDFNAVSRSVGFDEVSRAGGGYQLASRYALGWRGTWPSIFPVLDIDHVWVRTGWTILSCHLFTNLASDHRGQLVQLELPDGS